jgi:hypothetical protein
MSSLAKANLVLFALLIAHTVDHAVNQPARDLPATGSLVAVAGFSLVAISAVLAVTRRPQAPLAAVIAGAGTVLGIVAIHLAPRWYGEISDPYWDFSANALSWALLLAPLIAGAALAALGARQLGDRGRAIMQG